MTNLPPVLPTTYADGNTISATSDPQGGGGINGWMSTVDSIINILGGGGNPLAITGGTLNGTTLVAPALGTPVSGNLTNCTFPILNQNTTGTAAGITGKTTPTGALVGTTDTQTLTNKTLTSPTISGGTLDGVTIGATTPAVSVMTNELDCPPSVVLSGSQKLWLNRNTSLTGTITGNNYGNLLYVNDSLVQTNLTSEYRFTEFCVIDHILSPSVGEHCAIGGQVLVESVNTATNTQGASVYIGMGGSATNKGASLGGTAPTWAGGIGSYWGAVLQSILQPGAVNQQSIIGAEISVAAQTGSSTACKIGINLTTEIGDRAQGAVEDTALAITKLGINDGSPAWKNGITFGRQVNWSSWPFDSTSTMIGCAPRGAGTNPANIGIDFSLVTFTGPAFKTGAASIAMAEMASAPSGISSTGQIYVASDGSLHYLSPGGTDTRIATA